MGSESYRASVVGATGAVGSALVREPVTPSRQRWEYSRGGSDEPLDDGERPSEETAKHAEIAENRFLRALGALGGSFFDGVDRDLPRAFSGELR